MKLTAEQASEQLLGTCKSLHEVCTEGEQDDPEFCKQLDDLCLECEHCNWWVEPSEIVDDDGCCRDCAEAKDDQ